MQSVSLFLMFRWYVISGSVCRTHHCRYHCNHHCRRHCRRPCIKASSLSSIL